jgi:hypothetical protein
VRSAPDLASTGPAVDSAFRWFVRIHAAQTKTAARPSPGMLH